MSSPWVLWARALGSPVLRTHTLLSVIALLCEMGLNSQRLMINAFK